MEEKQEKEKLFENFKAIDTGIPKLALVKGHSGIGKSALIAELQRPILASHGNFISGKYNEYQTNIPFEAFLQAFDSFIDMLLTEDEEKLTYWRNAILDAVEDKGKLFVEYLPKMEIIIGEQEELPRLGPTELQVIFHNTTKAFIKALSKKETSSVIFLDDLQWVDRASLDMIRILNGYRK